MSGQRPYATDGQLCPPPLRVLARFSSGLVSEGGVTTFSGRPPEVGPVAEGKGRIGDTIHGDVGACAVCQRGRGLRLLWWTPPGRMPMTNSRAWSHGTGSFTTRCRRLLKTDSENVSATSPDGLTRKLTDALAVLSWGFVGRFGGVAARAGRTS